LLRQTKHRVIEEVEEISSEPKLVPLEEAERLGYDGSFRSVTLVSGHHFEHTFNQPGVFAYHCDFRGAAGGKDMAGVVKVVPR
jgi:plastocyanin